MGKLADLAVWDLNTLAHTGITDPVAALVLGSTPPLKLLMVNGAVVVAGDRVTTIDEDVVASDVARAHLDLVRKAG